MPKRRSSDDSYRFDRVRNARKVFHAPFLQADEDFSLEVVVTGNAERAADATAQYPGASVVATTDELFGHRPPHFGEEPASSWGQLGVDGSLRRVPGVSGSYATFYRRLADALLRGGPLPVDARDAASVIATIEAIRRDFPATPA